MDAYDQLHGKKPEKVPTPLRASRKDRAVFYLSSKRVSRTILITFITLTVIAVGLAVWKLAPTWAPQSAQSTVVVREPSVPEVMLEKKARLRLLIDDATTLAAKPPEGADTSRLTQLVNDATTLLDGTVIDDYDTTLADLKAEIEKVRTFKKPVEKPKKPEPAPEPAPAPAPEPEPEYVPPAPSRASTSSTVTCTGPASVSFSASGGGTVTLSAGGQSTSGSGFAALTVSTSGTVTGVAEGDGSVNISFSWSSDAATCY